MPFGLFETEQRARDERPRIEPFTPEEPGAFTGVGEGIGKGFMRGGARVAQALGMATSAPFVAYDMVTGKRTSDPIFNVTTMLVDPAMEYWTPAPSDVGMAGRVLGGFAEIGLPLMAGGGNPSLLAATMGLSEGAELVKAGASPGAATAVGVIQAGTLGIGFKIPFLGRTLAQRIGFGLGSNAALGVGSRAASAVALGSAPANLRDRYDPLDAEAAIVDAVTGAVFGGIAHLGHPAVRDSALTLNAAKHLEVDSAPGKPATDDARTAHVQAMEKATDQLMRGEPVNVSEEAPRLNFEPSTIKDKAVVAFKKLVDDVAKVELPPTAVAERAAELRRMGDGAGWAEAGGKLVRDPLSGEVTGRTEWVPKEDWFAIRPKDASGRFEMSAEEIRQAVNKALAGQRLGDREKRTIGFMLEEADRMIRDQGSMEARQIAADVIDEALRFNEAADEVLLSPEQTRMIERANEIDADAVERAAIAAGDDDAAFMQSIKGILDEEGRKDARASAQPGGATQAGGDARPAGGEAGAGSRDGAQVEGEETRPVGNPRREVERMEWDAAQQVADARPDLEVVGPNGDVMPAAELMRWADEMVQVAREDAAAITAAVQCYLRS